MEDGDPLKRALLRGIGVHHSGLPTKYRQVVEILFRCHYLRVVLATGVCVSVCVSVWCVSVCLRLSVSVCLCLCLSVSVCLSVCVSVCVCLYLCVCVCSF